MSFALYRTDPLSSWSDIEMKRAPARRDDRALDDVLQLADVAGPVIILHLAELLFREHGAMPIEPTARGLEKSSTASMAMSSLRPRSGGTSIGNTFSR